MLGLGIGVFFVPKLTEVGLLEKIEMKKWPKTA